MSAGRSPFLPLLFVALASALLGLQEPQAPKSGASLSVEGVVQLSKSGLAEDLIITKIKKNGKAFDLSTEEILELKRDGVSDNVIKFLLDPSQPFNPPPPPPVPVIGPEPPPKPITPTKKYPDDPYASKVPPEPGLYRFLEDAPAKIDLKMLLGVKEGAGFGKVLMKKPRTIGYLVGPVSKTKIAEPSPVFYLRLPEGHGIEEVVLVEVGAKGDRRELEMESGQKQEIKAAAMRQFDLLEVGARLFKISTSKLSKAEYLFFLMGSAEPAKGNYGKGYDFAIAEPAR